MQFILIIFISLSTILYAHCGGCGVGESSIEHIKIGNISIYLDNSSKKIEVKNNKETFTFDLTPKSWRDKFLVINDLYMDRICFDGFPATHDDLVEYKSHVWDKYSDYDKKIINGAYIYINPPKSKNVLEVNDIKKFSFFSKDLTTIGFYYNGSFYLFDTINNYTAVLDNNLCGSIPFLDLNNYPPNIIKTVELYLGGRASGFARGERIREVLSFNNGSYSNDELEEKNVFKQYYSNSILTNEELQNLKNNSFVNDDGYFTDLVSNNEIELIYKKFVDFLYYGKKLGKIQEIEDILNKVHPNTKKYIIENTYTINPYKN